MTHSNLADSIKELATPLAASLGLAIWGLELSFGGRGIVRIFVEKAENPVLELSSPASAPDGGSPVVEEYGQGIAQGVSIEECAQLSRLLSLALDVEDIMPAAYVLEISSPGLERVFFTQAQLAGALGKTVEITLHQPLPGLPDRRKFRGIVTGASAHASAVDGEHGDEAERESLVFTLQAEDCPCPGRQQEIGFIFSQVKKAKQVHILPDKTPPGKGKNTRTKNAKHADAGCERASAALTEQDGTE